MHHYESGGINLPGGIRRVEPGYDIGAVSMTAPAVPLGLAQLCNRLSTINAKMECAIVDIQRAHRTIYGFLEGGGGKPGEPQQVAASDPDIFQLIRRIEDQASFLTILAQKINTAE